MSSHEDGQRSDTVSPSRPPQAKVRRKPYQEGRQRIERKARTVQEERHELIHLINAHIDKGLSAADDLLGRDKDKFFKHYKDVSSQLDGCLDRLLCIKAQLTDECEGEEADDSVTIRSPSPGRSLARQISPTSDPGDQLAIARPSYESNLSQEERALVERVKARGLKKDSLVPGDGDSTESFEANESRIRGQEEECDDEVKGHNWPASDPVLSEEGHVEIVSAIITNPQVHLKSFSNQDFTVRGHDRSRAESETDHENTQPTCLSLPHQLVPLLSDDSGHRPSLVRTPELESLIPTPLPLPSPSQLDEGSVPSPDTVGSFEEHELDRFDTASSELYVSQEDVQTSPPPPPPNVTKAPLSNFSTSYDRPPVGPMSAALITPLSVPTNCHLSVRISHINSPSNFYVHTNRDQVNGLFNQIQYAQEKYMSPDLEQQVSPLSSALVGCLYATRYSSDISWYRVEVVDICPQSPKPIDVLFIDYGYSAMVTLADLCPLTHSLAEQAPHAIHCTLRGVEGSSGEWTPKAIDEFKNSVSFYSIRAVFYEPLKKQRSKVTFPVDLYLDWGSQEMNNVLLYLSPTEFVPCLPPTEIIKNFRVLSADETHPVRGPQIKSDKSEYLLTVISHVVSPLEFYVHIMADEEEEEAASQLDDLREHLNEHFSNSAQQGEPNIDMKVAGELKGTFWAAVYPNDSSWYRVRVLDMLPETQLDSRPQVLVQYIDFGNIEVVTLDELRPLTAPLASVPALAVKCHLAHIQPQSDTNTWSEEALRTFEELCGFELETVVTAHVLEKCQHGPCEFDTSLSVLLWNSPDTDVDTVDTPRDILINELLVKEGLASTQSHDWIDEAQKSLLTDNKATHRDLKVTTPEPEEGSSSEDEEELASFPIERLAINAIVLLKVTCAESPDSFYGLLPYGLETLDETGCESLHELVACAEEAPHADRFRSLSEELTSRYGHGQQDDIDEHNESETSPRTFYGHGSLVAAKDYNGAVVFRGRVVGYIVGESLYRVHCVDSGFYRLIPRNCVVLLDVEFYALPAYAVKCSLANIEPFKGPDSQWSGHAIHTFKEYTEGKSFAAHIISTSHGTLCVELLGLDEDNSVSVVEFMVGLSLAREPLAVSLGQLELSNTLARLPTAEEPFLVQAAATIAASSQLTSRPSVEKPPLPPAQHPQLTLATATANVHAIATRPARSINSSNSPECGQHYNFGYVDEEDGQSDHSAPTAVQSIVKDDQK